MLLAAVVESLSGETLDQFCPGDNLPAPGADDPGLQSPCLILSLLRGGHAGPPLQKHCRPTAPRYQPAQAAPNNRKPHVCRHRAGPHRRDAPSAGEVHDENAWAAGGVAGHAGLFGPGREVFHLLAGLWRASWRRASRAALTPAAVQLFLTVPPGADRALRLRHPRPRTRPRGPRGVFSSSRSVGHLGIHRHLFLAGPGDRPDGSLTDEPGPPGPGRQEQNPGLPALGSTR